jgi:drug/metabolite transporter (DMT)-like permease|tara:strand:+ start:598 stop:1500 length:903 start_codon:yes stop_codon:yes gene_type:complete
LNKLSVAGLVHLSIVYVLWGSTYLAIRIAVQEGSGFPPMIMSATRVFCGSIILMSLAKIFYKDSLKINRDEFLVLFISGIALWFGGNGLVAIAETNINSGYAALIIACTPIWVAAIESYLNKRTPSLFLLGSLVISILGITILNWPAISTNDTTNLWSTFLLIFAGLSWGAGSIYQKRKGLKISPEVSSAYQQIFGGLVLFIASFVLSEPNISPSFTSWLAWAYLIIFGSVIAFTSFIKALKLLPANIVFTYAFINPIVAVLLGLIVLNEPITIWTLVGSPLILIGVFGVFKEKNYRTNR